MKKEEKKRKKIYSKNKLNHEGREGGEKKR